MVNSSEVSVVLNVYQRSKHFPAQLESIQNQTVKPHEILVWENGAERVPDELAKFVTVARASKNFGVWARFAHALNATGEFVCIIDDDTIPGKNWLRNCLDTMSHTPGLLGTRGLTFESENNYSINREAGVYGSNDETTQVDIVGHSWFFRREWLAAYWAEYGFRFDSPLAGEDIHFSFAVQKHLGLPTLVPPHRNSHPDEWGSDPRLARRLGEEGVAISKSPTAMRVFEDALQHYRMLGFRTLAESTDLHSKPASRYPNWVYRFASRFPGMSHRLGGLGLIRAILARINRFN